MAAHPSPAAPVPRTVTELTAGRQCLLVWSNALGGSTYQVTADGRSQFVKWAPAGSALDLADEVDRLRWAVPYTAVPEVLDHGSNGEGSWLVTAGLPGTNAVTDHWKADPATAVTAIGAGLRALHDTLPVDSCPFSWSAESRVAVALRQVEHGRLDAAEWGDEHPGLPLDAALGLLSDVPRVDRLVVCHGDACAPNTLIGADGRWTAHVDLGSLGVADRWADLAVATWSIEWNYGPGWDGLMLDAYGVSPDPQRMRYYRTLWELSP